MAEYLSKSIEGNVIPIPKTEDARFNNVKGYCKFGHYKWGKKKTVEPPTPEETETSPAPESNPEPALESENPQEPEKTKEKSGRVLSWMRR